MSCLKTACLFILSYKKYYICVAHQNGRHAKLLNNFIIENCNLEAYNLNIKIEKSEFLIPLGLTSEGKTTTPESDDKR